MPRHLSRLALFIVALPVFGACAVTADDPEDVDVGEAELGKNVPDDVSVPTTLEFFDGTCLVASNGVVRSGGCQGNLTKPEYSFTFKGVGTEKLQGQTFTFYRVISKAGGACVAADIAKRSVRVVPCKVGDPLQHWAFYARPTAARPDGGLMINRRSLQLKTPLSVSPKSGGNVPLVPIDDSATVELWTYAVPLCSKAAAMMPRSGRENRTFSRYTKDSDMIAGTSGVARLEGGKKADIRFIDHLCVTCGLTKKQRELLHREISGKNMTKDEIRQLAIDISLGGSAGDDRLENGGAGGGGGLTGGPGEDSFSEAYGGGAYSCASCK